MVAEEAVRSKYARKVPATVEEQTRAHAKAGRRYWAPELRKIIAGRMKAGEHASDLATEYGSTREAILGVVHRERWGWRRTNGRIKQPLLDMPKVERVKAVTLARICLPDLSDRE